MKALSVKLPWSLYIACGEKKVEYRTWQTAYRGEVLICTSSTPAVGFKRSAICGQAICLATLTNCMPFKKSHLEQALMEEMPEENGYAFFLSNIRPITPTPVKGKLHIFDVNIEEKDLQFLPHSGEDLVNYYVDEGLI